MNNHNIERNYFIKYRFKRRNYLIIIYKIKQDIHINMLPIDGQTAGPDGLNFFLSTCGWPWSVIGLKINL